VGVCGSVAGSALHHGSGRHPRQPPHRDLQPRGSTEDGVNIVKMGGLINEIHPFLLKTKRLFAYFKKKRYLCSENFTNKRKSLL